MSDTAVLSFLFLIIITVILLILRASDKELTRRVQDRNAQLLKRALNEQKHNLENKNKSVKIIAFVKDASLLVKTIDYIPYSLKCDDVHSHTFSIHNLFIQEIGETAAYAAQRYLEYIQQQKFVLLEDGSSVNLNDITKFKIVNITKGELK